MCKSSTDAGGPRRCSGDTRAAYGQSSHAVAVLEEAETVLLNKMAESDPASTAPESKTVSFGDKSSRVEDVRREIDEAIANLNTAEQWTRFLETASKFPTYSVPNQLLVLMQRPDATYVGGLKNMWNEKFNRSLIPGSKAIWIKAPNFQKRLQADGTEKEVLTHFSLVPVYDIADTKGPPLPTRPEVKYTREEGVAPPEMRAELTKQANAHGYVVEHRLLPADGPEGYTQTEPEKKVVISTRYSSAHQSKVLAHELAHIELGHTERHHEYHNGPDGQRHTMEVEAESVAYVIGRHYGLNPGSYAFAYIDGWAKGNQEAVNATSERVNKACKSIISKLPETAEPEVGTEPRPAPRAPRRRAGASSRRGSRW